ncbi:MAG: aminoacyl-tRNA hydrolase [Bacteroidales bacterium]|nr:aminoacyl-tRNA hydrolase [Bacteroidales bacterium]
MSAIEKNILTGRNLDTELIFSASRSSGPGGQHVNKVSTKVELRFDVLSSKLLTPEEKGLIMSKLAGKITKEDVLVLHSQTERSQYDNKIKVTEKFYRLILKALTPEKKRKPTRPTNASKQKRIETKRMLADKKNRRKVKFDE